MNKEKLLKKGNASIAVGTLYGLSGAAISCPLCILVAGGLVVNGIREKVL